MLKIGIGVLGELYQDYRWILLLTSPSSMLRSCRGTGVYEGVGVKALRVDSENRGPQYRTLNSRILIIRTPI